ncbi:MucR family transcriptional regulator [Methylobacterium brachythecii]|uniref:Transcriptional regulator n=1 Tax=Methylobacterium brachythecii TaxID=1176177 RepID=A0A7W6F989_9HYPH|nr:MucR family transcriptional regulator [Methylobacterium brachythecii]MBB3905272.1 putative transcriptional regulator [Methylobacterium brachythecii]GLS45955.1 transcriptional regulator [Methylobacterium brachythecii]
MSEPDDAVTEPTLQTSRPIRLAADIVAMYVANNSLPSDELPNLISRVHAALSTLSATGETPDDPEDMPTPGQIKRSITPDALISFIDGKSYKTLKRHLSTHGLDFEGYRARFGLPSNYPMVASTYSAKRSEMAKQRGFGLRNKG